MVNEIKRILITGASGMVGRNLLECPGIEKYEILAPSKKILNLLEQADVLQYLYHSKPDLIIHCAGLVGGIKDNKERQADYLYQNTMIGSNIINGAKEAGIKRLLNLGSSCMYPVTALNPLKEESLLTGRFEPTNEGYALAKVFALRLCEYITNSNQGLSYKTLIPCNLYGKYDKFDDQTAHLIPAAIRKIYEAKKSEANAVEIWGDGTARREFMCAGDFAQILLRCVDIFDKLPQNLNAGNGFDYSIDHYYRIVCEALDYYPKFNYDLSKPSGIKQKLLDISKQKDIGAYVFSSTYERIKETVNYFLTVQGVQTNV